jgi:hypothetical protein
MTWNMRIYQAGINGGFTEKDRDDVDCWGTCAIGELKLPIPSTSSGEPYDTTLKFKGLRFASLVHGDHVIEAAKLLTEIQDRAANLVGAA